MLIAILIINVLTLGVVLSANRELGTKIANLENSLDELLQTAKDPNYHGVSDDGHPYTIAKH